METNMMRARRLLKEAMAAIEKASISVDYMGFAELSGKLDVAKASIDDTDSWLAEFDKNHSEEG